LSSGKGYDEVFRSLPLKTENVSDFRMKKSQKKRTAHAEVVRPQDVNGEDPSADEWTDAVRTANELFDDSVDP
jgi:hypothetical protein